MKNDLVFLSHIRDEIAFLERIREGRTFDDLINDDYFSHAVRSALEIIGEASKSISDALKQTHADIPWREMAALRDRIIHGYFSIDYSIVWNVLTEDLPHIKPMISELLKEQNKEPR